MSRDPSKEKSKILVPNNIVQMNNQVHNFGYCTSAKQKYDTC